MNVEVLGILVAVLAGATVFCLGLALRLNSKKAAREENLDNIIDRIVESEIKVERKNSGVESLGLWYSYWYKRAQGSGMAAESPSTPGNIAIIVAVFSSLAATLVWPRSLLIGIVLAAALTAGFSILLRAAADKRLSKMESQLPGLLSGMRANLQASMTSQQAMLAVIDDTPSPLREEMVELRGEIELGVPLDTALGNMSSRVPSEEFRFMIASLRTALIAGVDPDPLLKTIQEIIVQRAKIAQNLASAVAQAKPTIWVTAIMIPGGFLFSYLSDETNRAFWHSFFGLLALGVVAGLYVLSLFVSKKQVDKIKKA